MLENQLVVTFWSLIYRQKKEMARGRFAFLPLKLSQFYFVYNLQLQLATQAKSRRQNGRVARNHRILERPFVVKLVLILDFATEGKKAVLHTIPDAFAVEISVVVILKTMPIFADCQSWSHAEIETVAT